MNIRQIVAVFLALCLMNMSAFAQKNILTFGDLVRACSTPQAHWVDFCNGFFQAVHDQQAAAGKICAPEGTTRTQLVTVFEKNAAKLMAVTADYEEMSGFGLASVILADNFPCD